MCWINWPIIWGKSLVVILPHITLQNELRRVTTCNVKTGDRPIDEENTGDYSPHLGMEEFSVSITSGSKHQKMEKKTKIKGLDCIKIKYTSESPSTPQLKYHLKDNEKQITT